MLFRKAENPQAVTFMSEARKKQEAREAKAAKDSTGVKDTTDKKTGLTWISVVLLEAPRAF